MKFLLISLLLWIFNISTLLAQQRVSKAKFTIQAELDPSQYPDSISIDINPFQTVEIPSSRSLSRKAVNGKASWIIFGSVPHIVSMKFLPRTHRIVFLAEPGDNITLKFKAGKLSASGSGATKILLKLRLNEIRDSLNLSLTNKKSGITKSLEDYLEWNQYLNNRIKLSLPVLEAYKSLLSSVAYFEIRNSILDAIADERSDKFGSFRGFANKNGYTNKDIRHIYDSTYLVNSTLKQLPSLSGEFFGSWGFIRNSVYRKYDFNFDVFPLNSKSERHKLYYELGCSLYSGLALEKFKVDFLTSQVIHEDGLTNESESLLSRYYAEPGYPKYKLLVKRYEEKARTLREGQSFPDFVLVDTQGKKVHSSNLRGKVVLVDFWFTGCIGCIQMTPALRKIEEVFKNDSNVVFLSISTDKSRSQWLNSIKEGKYTTGTSLNVYTEGLGNAHLIIKNFLVNGYPSLYLMDATGKVVVNPVPDPRNNGTELVNLIKKQLSLLKDGPYVFNNNGDTIAYQINGEAVNTTQAITSNTTFRVSTDVYQKSFELRLHKSKEIQPIEFPAPEKLLALSDIEGNFDAFRRLLQSNNVIDEDMNWKFGKGHLVFAGDMFDRGEQVTECLWLIYSMEEKAKAAGGYVHFVLGNHELMNLSGSIGYVKEKYIENAKRIGKTYMDLFRENSELGRWLRTKNIVEKVGLILFTHGGISPEFIELGLPLNKVNELARPYYANDSTARNSNDRNLATIFSTKKGPFWYRDYYLDVPKKIVLSGAGIDTVYRTSDETINKTLAFYKVKHIVTGHTIVNPGEHISVHYNNKVINTDTDHAKGKSEALLVVGDTYYRVNDQGQRWLLFKDEDDMKSPSIHRNNK